MARIILSDEQKRINEVQHLYESQKNKVYDFSVDDFIIDNANNFKHKSWKTKVKGGIDRNETIAIIERYITECNKPLNERNLDFIHLS